MQERWYRFPVPPGTRAFLSPPRARILSMYLNGKPLTFAPGDAVDLGPLDWSQPNVLAISLPGSDELLDFAQFQTGENTYRLGSWTRTGLTYFSGEAFYEKSFTLDPKLRGRRVELDLGEVGLTAEVWLNGKKVGERVWAPFRFDVTGFLLPNQNVIRIAVTNSDANQRAEAGIDRYLERKKLNLMPNVFPYNIWTLCR